MRADRIRSGPAPRWRKMQCLPARPKRRRTAWATATKHQKPERQSSRPGCVDRHARGDRRQTRRRGQCRRRRVIDVDRRRLLLRVFLDLAPARDVLGMLVKRFGKHVAAGAVGNEIEFLGARRIGNGFERRHARIGDRSGRKTVNHISVVRRRLGRLRTSKCRGRACPYRRRDRRRWSDQIAASCAWQGG